MKSSSTLKCQVIVQERKEAGLPVYNFGSLVEIQFQFVKLIQTNLPNLLKRKIIHLLKVFPKLQQATKEYMSTNLYKVEHTLFGNGLKELLFLVQIAHQGLIYHVTPAWVSYKSQVEMMGKANQLRFYNTTIEEGFKINPNKLDELFSTTSMKNKLFVFNNPCNPTGVVYTKSELKDIAMILRKHDCLVVADEIYLNLSYTEDTCTIADFIPERTICGSSVSKDLGCGGYRLGWLTFPKELTNFFNKCSGMASTLYSCPCVPVQYATAYMLNDRMLVKQICLLTKTLFKLVLEKVCKVMEKTKLRYIVPNAAWYLLIDFSEYSDFLNEHGVYDGDQLSDFLIQQKGIVTVSGKSFGIDGLYCRFSLVDMKFDKNGSVFDPSVYSNTIKGFEELVDLFLL